MVSPDREPAVTVPADASAADPPAAEAPPLPSASPWLPTPAQAQAAQHLAADLDWLAALVAARFEHYFSAARQDAPAEPPRQAAPADPVHTLLAAPPDLAQADSPYADFLRQHGASAAERAGLLLALAPHLRPALLDVFCTRNQSFDKPFTEFGGLRGAGAGEFTPTGETLAFVLAGADLAQRLAVMALFDRAHWWARHDVLLLVPTEPEAPRLQGRLSLSASALARLTTGAAWRPHLGAAFPASRLHTGQRWSDLVLHPGTLAQVQEISTWLQHGPTLLHGWGMAAKLRPGLRVLLHGPPGTGKTLTAALLGQSSGREVYRVDLSLVVSKYIGETEKNLGRVFDAAQHQGWILFFDEADALFGKRSETRDAQDRYANQEVAYLLQRIEAFDGVTVLASNLKDHIDPAFARRFEAVIYFPAPRAEERLRLWQQAFPAAVRLDAAIDLAQVAARHPLSGGAILNVVRHACLAALADGSHCISPEALQRGIRRELAKDGRAGDAG